MNFNETCAQEALVREAKEFVQKNNLSKSQESCGAAMHRRCWDLFAVAGYCGMPLPETDGGGGIGLMDSMLVFETLAVAGVDIGLLFSLGVHQFAAAVPLALAGTDAQKSKWLATMARGEAIGALAVSEADAGADSYAMQARAVETDEGFTITGEKLWISNAPIADLILVCARTDDLPGAFGISCFLVTADADGVSVANGPVKAGLRNAPWGTVRLDQVHVSDDDMLGGRGGGGAVFGECMRWERCGLFAIALGAMQRGLEDCVARVRNRQQFGGALIDNDVVAKSVALMKTRLDAARLLLYRAAATIDDGKADEASISLAKAYVSESAIANALAAQELYGALGITAEHDASALLNDMLPFRVLSGPNDVHYKIASRLIFRGAR
jgi:alkylation response protein AidB-like acyl-CoA dehydrogenase